MRRDLHILRQQLMLALTNDCGMGRKDVFLDDDKSMDTRRQYYEVICLCLCCGWFQVCRCILTFPLYTFSQLTNSFFAVVMHTNFWKFGIRVFLVQLYLQGQFTSLPRYRSKQKCFVSRERLLLRASSNSNRRMTTTTCRSSPSYPDCQARVADHLRLWLVHLLGVLELPK